MPQIRCPNCGLNINLENRRETDFALIVNALKDKERSFTELLHITKLPRKTLNLRLKELQRNGTIVKSGAYYLNGACSIDYRGERMKKDMSFLVKRKTVLALLALIIGLPVTSTVLANIFLSAPTLPETPQLKGVFVAEIKVYNALDVYAWQAKIKYDQSKLRVEQIISGDFLGNIQYPFLLDSTDSEEDILLVFGTLQGDVSGRNGNGTLAIIIFGYYSDKFDKPELVFDGKTWLLNSKLEPAPGTISLNIHL